MRVLTAATLAAALALPAAALALEAPRDYAGKWWISGVSEGAEVCTVTLTDEAAIGGWAIEIPKDCFGKFGFSEDVAAWAVYPDGAIGFIDPLRKGLLKFEPSAIGGYVAEPDDGPALSMDRVTEGDRELTETERMSGTWSLGSMGEVFCVWDSTAAADGMSGTLVRDEPCLPAWRGIVRWERAKGRLMLIDDKGKIVRALPGDGIQGFFSPLDGEETLGFTRQW